MAVLHSLVIKQIIKIFLPRVFGIGLMRYPSRFFVGLAHLKKIAEIRFLFINNVGFDWFTALKPSGGVKMPAAATGAQIGLAMRATITPGDFSFKAGILAAIPAEEAFFFDVFIECHNYEKVKIKDINKCA